MANRRGRRKRRTNPNHRKIKRIIDGEDFISSMPDDILHHILSFISTDLAMRTSVLSRRWRHVWSETPCLYIVESDLKPVQINQTLTSYRAPKITTFHLFMTLDHTAPKVHSWINFAISRNVKNLTVNIICFYETYRFPDLFYLSSSVEQLSVIMKFCEMIPSCTVSWKSLRNLSLFSCKIRDESMDNILSGCPILESLTLYACNLLERLDLSKSPSLKILKIDRQYQPSGPIEIVAPHINYLFLKNSKKLTTLVDVSSLTEANLDICISRLPTLESNLFQIMAIDMLAKSRNVERLTVGPNLLQILSLPEFSGVPFPTLKVQTLIVKTEPARSVIPGLVRLLQNSPGLKKLRVHTMHNHNIMDMILDRSWDSRGLNLEQCCRSKHEVFPNLKEISSMLGCNDETSKLLASFMELILRNTKTLESMVVWLGDSYFKDDAEWFEEMLQMVETISHNYNNVSIVLKLSNC